MPQEPVLTVDKQKFNDVWNEHLRAESSAHSADETVATMVANPRINQVPVMIGGDGKEEVYEFYRRDARPFHTHARRIAAPRGRCAQRDSRGLAPVAH